MNKMVFCLMLFLSASSDASLYLDDNGTHNVDYFVDGYISVSHNTKLNFFDNAECIEINTYDRATINIYGGKIESGIWALNSVRINIYGGLPGFDIYTNPDFVDDDLLAFGTSVITLYGSNFNIDGLPAQTPLYSTTHNQANVPSEPRHQLTGILSDGTLIDINAAVFYNARIEFVNVPEPATFLLFSLGVVMLRRKR